MKTYDVYLFDLDGTLTDTAFVWLDIFRQCLADFGVADIPDDVIAQHTHNWDEFVKLGVPAPKLLSFVDAAKAQAGARLCEAPMHNGVLSLLSELRQHHKKTGIFTSMARTLLEPVIEQHGLDSLVEAMVAGSDVKQLKPNPEGIFKVLNMLGTTENMHSRVVYIGDKDTDIQAAQNAGIDSVLFFPPAHQGLYDQTALQSMQPTAVINSWQELQATL